ncbi:MAG: CPBP family intramembrane glutamic endopeptidase [Steroidobacteraceae bacterium]
MTQLDWLYSTLIAVLLVVDHFIFMATFRRRSAADPREAFRWLWFMFLRYMWLLTALGVFLWIYEGRAWGEIAASTPAAGWRSWSNAGLVLMVALLYARGASRVARSARAREKVRNQLSPLGTLGAMLPRTRSDFQLWVYVSVTAGISEEFLFRGYLIWVFHHWVGWWVAATVSLAVFSLAHSYQGPNGVLRSALAGALFTVVVATFDSLLPAMAMHALIDIGSGYIAWLAFRDVRTPESTSMPATS